jgi:hypothetical protein
MHIYFSFKKKCFQIKKLKKFGDGGLCPRPVKTISDKYHIIQIK